MKKKYSLDYTIERDTDRLKAVEEILDHLDSNPNSSDLEQMASYILYGKDENGKNSIQRGETDDRETKRYGTFKTADERNESLDEILSNPLTNQADLKDVDERYIYLKKKRTIKKPKYDKEGNLIDIGDADIPGMEELWDSIDRIEHTINVNKGLVDGDGNEEIISDPYRLWQLNHILIDLKRHQYYLLESYKPTLHFANISHSTTPTYNFDSDTFYWMTRAEWDKKLEKMRYRSDISRNLEDYETRENPITGELEIKWLVRRHTFNWENSWHVKNLILHYSAIYMQCYDKMDSWGRTLIYDFDRYATLAELSPAREFILLRRIDRASPEQIAEDLRMQFGLDYKPNHILEILDKEIPQKIADTALRLRLLKETPMEERKVCPQCKQALPATPLFFYRNASKQFGVESSCKECQRKMKIKRGVLGAYDTRYKDKTLHEMQARKARE